MAVIKYKNPKYIEGSSELKYIPILIENKEIYIGINEPTNGEKIWIDSNNGIIKYKNNESWLIPEIDLSNYLSKTNILEYTPSEEYNPATKKYVDDKAFNFKVLNLDDYKSLGEIVNSDNIIYFITN